jgi:hypothetical protein
MSANPDVIAEAIADEIGRPVSYREAETDARAGRWGGWPSSS